MTSPHGSPTPSSDPWSGPPSGTPAPPSWAAGTPAPSMWAGGSPAPSTWAARAPAASTDWGPSPPPPPSTNAWSVVALVTGLIGLVPVAVPAAIAGIVQTTRRRQAGRGLAIAGLVAAALWTVGALVLVVVLAGAWEARTGTPADVGTAAVGDCLQAPADGSSRWTAVSCTDVHDAEVYLVEDLAGTRGDDTGLGDWPGEDDVEARADDVCHESFDDYVGASYLASAYDYSWFTPRADDWADGERRLVCVVVPYEDDVLRGPVRGSGE